ncbi:MAG: nucleotide exchange factor GrpE [Steroidobacteraceae bacterium]
MSEIPPTDGSEATRAAPAATDEGQSLEQKLAEAEQRLLEQRDALLRAVADLDNYRRRVAREVEQARQFGAERLAEALLPVLDSMELALANAGSADPKVLLEGQQATLRLLVKAMGGAGITEIDPLGQAFDPAQHEAMAMQPSAEAAPDTILNVIQKGYVLNGRLLRPARVIIARAVEA